MVQQQATHDKKIAFPENSQVIEVHQVITDMQKKWFI